MPVRERMPSIMASRLKAVRTPHLAKIGGMANGKHRDVGNHGSHQSGKQISDGISPHRGKIPLPPARFSSRKQREKQETILLSMSRYRVAW